MHRWLLGFVLDLSTTPDALDLLQSLDCLRLGAKLRGGSVKLQINIIVDSVAQKHSPGVLPSKQLQLMVLDHARTASWSKLLISVTNGQKAWMKRIKISGHVGQNFKHIFSHSTVFTYQIGSGEQKAKFFSDNGEYESTSWPQGTPCQISCCMMVMLYVRCCRLRRAKSFCRTCPLWKAPGNKCSGATEIASRYHVRRYLVGASRPLRIGDHLGKL